MADPNTSITHFDEFIRIWAVAGPVLTACVAAWWNRKNELENREFNRIREKEIELFRNDQSNKDKIIDFNKNMNYEIKKSLLSFVSIAVNCHNSCLLFSIKNEITHENLEDHKSTVCIISDSFNELYLLSPPDEILNSSIKLLSCITQTTLDMYKDISLRQKISDDFISARTEVLKSAKTYFEKEASRMLDILEK